MNNFQTVFGGIIVYILLVLYASTISYMTYMVAFHQTKEFPSEIVSMVTTIGGLISALVIAKLAITPPGKPPAVVTPAAVAAGTGPDPINVWLTIAYMIAWLVFGCIAFVFGVLLHPGVNQALASIGTTWFGLAVAAGYAYFGLKP